jgi:hypothetical protein
MKHLHFLVIVFLIGCRPAEMPTTIPCKITVVNDGVPQVGYDVGLRSVTGNGSLSIMGYTNSSGVTNIQTRLANYKVSGAPAGTYKVTIDKQVQLPSDGVDTSRFSEAELNAYIAKRAEEAEKLRTVPVRLTNASTTPFEIKLEPGGTAQWTFDLKEHTNKDEKP